jgi:N-acetylglucosaminyldiphosphoundecaprenol N-acetyl-beta-D-mannosaminyltransferase
MATVLQPTIDPPRFAVAGVRISRTDYAHATRSIIDAARHRRPFVAAATSVHGVALAVRREEFRAALNSFDMVTPDGQPVRWALNLIHDTRLPERVYGPTLTLRVCEAAAAAGLSVYFYGSRPEVLEKLERRMRQRLPHLSIAGTHSPPFRTLSSAEEATQISAIRESRADIVFVGLGCQEVWAYKHRDQLGVPLVCVGAAFDFHAGTLRQAPPWMQAHGLEWLFRVLMEPRRLWRRYAEHIPVFVAAVSMQLVADRLTRQIATRHLPLQES